MHHILTSSQAPSDPSASVSFSRFFLVTVPQESKTTARSIFPEHLTASTQNRQPFN